MNHFAHLVLSQMTVESVVGNLLGDFARGVKVDRLSPAILAGLLNHRAVDRFTDNHPFVLELKHGFSREKRRFAGIALDIYFDHLLINEWRRFEHRDLQQVIDDCYSLMQQGMPIMPGDDMQRITRRMVEYDWFGSYRDLDSIADSMDRVASRIRFPNRFERSIEDILRMEDRVRKGFIRFYPELQQHVAELALEADKP